MSARGPLVLPFGGATPTLDPTCWVAPTATLVGGVRLGARVSVWFGAVLRADGDVIEIGEHSNVQDNAVFHCDLGKPVTVGRRVSVGHAAILHGCTVEDDVLVGMGAMVLNGARIGAGSLVAAGAVVREGQQVPPGSLVAGVPGRVLRAVTEAETARVHRNARAYVDLAVRYAQETAGPAVQRPAATDEVG